MAGKFALIIGSSRYDDPNLGRLTAPDLDAQGLEEVLKSPVIGQFDDVLTLLNEGTTAVRKAIARFYDRRQRDDLLLLYFSGHGVKDEQGQLYLALRDTEVGLLAGSAIETSFIATQMDRSFSKRQVLVLDCCHSGAFPEGAKAAQGASVGTAEAFEGTGLGRVVLTATDSAQYAWEGDRIIGDAQSSLFTHFLVDGLRTGGADRNRDGMVTVDELYDYVREQVVEATPRQTPRKWTYRQEGDIVVARNPFARDSALPLEIEAARTSKLSTGRQQAVHELEKLLRGSDEPPRAAALAALKELALDDSRKVANAAIQALKAYERERQVDSLGQLTIEARRHGEAVANLPPAAQPTDDHAAPIHVRGERRPSDIFISYEHRDRDRARELAHALGAQGWTVWWDRRIAPGEAFDVVIERELSTSKCVIVLWSSRSVGATWVRNEARRAARRAVLVPILIEAVEPPLEFDNLQAADLTTWDEANMEHSEFAAVLDRIQALAPGAERALRVPADQARHEPLEPARHDPLPHESLDRTPPEPDAREREPEPAVEVHPVLEVPSGRVDGLGAPPEPSPAIAPEVGIGLGLTPDRSRLALKAAFTALTLAIVTAAAWFVVFRPAQPVRSAASGVSGDMASTVPATEAAVPPSVGSPAEAEALRTDRLEILVPARPGVTEEKPGASQASEPAAPPRANAEEFRARARGQRLSGDHVLALKTVLDGLRLVPDDAGLTAILTALLSDARSAAARSKQAAVDLEARESAPDLFARGLRSEGEAARLQRAGPVDAAVRAWWTATDQFKAAAARARQVADEEVVEPPPNQKPPRPQPSPQAPARPLPDSGIEQNLVNAALRRYEAGYGSLNAQAVREVYPTAPIDQLTREFAACQSYVLKVEASDYRFLFTDTLWVATVAATVSYEITPKSGKPTRGQRTQTIQLVKEGSGWVIRQIR